MGDVILKSITLSSLEERYLELSSSLVRTPTVKLTSPFLIDLIKASQIYLKLECFQYSGTFKARGALSVAKQIPEKDKKFGITAASAGNHAIAGIRIRQELGSVGHRQRSLQNEARVLEYP